MIVIGELINGMYRQVGKAIVEKDKKTIQRVAKEQLEQGANVLDVNTGPVAKDPVDAMMWLTETIQEAVDAPLCFDSTKAAVIEAGLKLAKRKAIINSTSADDEKLNKLLPLAKKYNAQIIGLTTDKGGVPRDRYKRSELALKIISSCMEHGLDTADVYIDPIVLPVNVAQAQAVELLESIREFKLISDPPPKTVVGLSNVSQGTKNRNLINRTFLVMAVANGLSAAIVDPLDKELMDAMITAELILNKSIYCDSYLDAYRKR
ncbi:MAG: dihydropteroate synthase [Candidatus Omnitrophica bacterium]|nr:dihydropteroate synthase [Candidatus Omnitrophota bacterium]